MTLQLNVGEAKTRLSELVARVEAGEEVIIARRHKPVVKLVAVGRPARTTAAIAGLRALRGRLSGPAVSVADILAWRHEDHDR